MMELLARFDPYLSGAVLSGSAGKYSDIDLLLFTDSMKDVELFLLDRRIAYRSGERRIHIGDELRGVPNFNVSTEDADFDITVFAPRDLRSQIRNTPEGRPLERVRIDWLMQCLPNTSRSAPDARLQPSFSQVAASSAKYVRIASAPARLNANSASMTHLRSSIQPFCPAALSIAYSPLT